jgi:hypothetical protein
MKMPSWLKRVRGVVVMGLVWGAAWGVAGGAIMEGIVDPHGEILDMWPQTLAIVGFVGGVAFSTVLGLAARRRRFAELSLAQFAVWGAVAGLLQGAFATRFGAPPAFIAFTAVVGVIAGCATLTVARMADERRSLHAGAEEAPR